MPFPHPGAWCDQHPPGTTPGSHWLPQTLLSGNLCSSAKDAAELEAWLHLLGCLLFPPMGVQGPTQALLSHSLLRTCSVSARAALEPQDLEKLQLPRPRKPQAVYTAWGPHGFPGRAPQLCCLEGVPLPSQPC